MLEVWGRKNSSNVISVMWTIGELGLECVRHNLGGSFGGLDTPEYADLNPNQLVPTINHQGLVLWESNAIVRYLSAAYGVGTLWPDDPQVRARADQWMDWLKTTVYPAFMPVFFGLIRLPPEQQQHDVIAAMAVKSGQVFGILERHLAQHDYVAGNRFSMGDIPLGGIIHRYLNLDIERPALPGVDAWYRRLCQRPAYRQHAMIPFGDSLQEWLALERAGAGDG